MKTVVAVILLLLTSSVWSHHSYAMFDGSRTLSVSGTVAKLEWMNPHVFVWLYVPNSMAKEGYDLYVFENGSPNVLARLGWTRTSLTAGEKIVVEYWPLKDGRNGGHFTRTIYSDGRILYGAGGPNAATVGEPQLAPQSPTGSERPKP
jgi:uncharacterized protein DUF6152